MSASQFKPGQSGNPKGRPIGARSKLGEEFLADLYAHWRENGREAIATVYAQRPQDYLKIVASLMPKQLEIERKPISEMTDAELVAILEDARDRRAEEIEEGDEEDETPRAPELQH